MLDYGLITGIVRSVVDMALRVIGDDDTPQSIRDDIKAELERLDGLMAQVESQLQDRLDAAVAATPNDDDNSYEDDDDFLAASRGY